MIIRDKNPGNAFLCWGMWDPELTGLWVAQTDTEQICAPAQRDHACRDNKHLLERWGSLAVCGRCGQTRQHLLLTLVDCVLTKKWAQCQNLTSTLHGKVTAGVFGYGAHRAQGVQNPPESGSEGTPREGGAAQQTVAARMPLRASAGIDRGMHLWCKLQVGKNGICRKRRPGVKMTDW